MKKRISVIIVMALLFCTLFSVPTHALVSKKVWMNYIGQGAYITNSADKWYQEFLGNKSYWQEGINKETWTGETRPERMMGDANIDGKITAADALVALHFAVNGNIQTYTIISGAGTPEQLRWPGKFSGKYREGTLLEEINSPENWLTYCYYNSPFFADVTKDCVVNAKDALKILQYCVGKAEDFPVGDFTTIIGRFCYYPWPTEYYPGIFEELSISMTDEEFCEKYNFSLEETPTDKN